MRIHHHGQSFHQLAPTYRVVVVCLLLFWLAFASSSPYSFDHDTAQDCADRLDDCTTSKATFLQCPIACAKFLEPLDPAKGSSHGQLDDETFYQLEAKDDVNGNTIRFENYEGYVTVIAALPRQQAGVANFYYEMLEHLHDVYPYTLEILIAPSLDSTDEGTGIVVPHDKKSKVSFLSKADSTRVLTLLQQGLYRPLETSNKATLYLVGADGDTVEAFVSPTMPDFQRYLRYHFVNDLGEQQQRNEF